MALLLILLLCCRSEGLSRLSAPSVMTSTSVAKKEEALPLRRCTALFEFEAAEAGELSFNAGDVIEVCMFVC